jgi:hypothetical protein
LYRPGYVVRNYLAGKRVNYFSPLAYLFLLSAVSSFVSHFAVEYRAMRFDFTYMMFPGVAVFFNHYPALMFCLLTPFLAFWTWLFNRDLKYNYWENFIFNTYLIAQFNVILILFDMARIMQWYTSPKLTPMIILFIGYMVFTSRQFFKHKFSVVRISLNTAMYLCNAFTFMTGLVFAGFMTPWWPDSF